MLENTQNFRNDSGDENTLFKRAYVQGNLNGVKITAGRQFFKSGYGFYAVATNIKALKVDVGNVLKASAFVGRTIIEFLFAFISRVVAPTPGICLFTMPCGILSM